VETEAYGGNNDPASHAFKKITNRNRLMFGNVGKVYVYYIYGNHYCFNIVAKQKDITAGAILIRSIQPTEGINLMRIFRRTENIMNLTTGPGKLTQAFKITNKHNGLDLTDINNNFFYLENNQEETNYNKFKVLKTTRIGISNAIEKKWRFIMMKQEKKNTN
jgi:DNA-3-methyladenine glycosylase